MVLGQEPATRCPNVDRTARRRSEPLDVRDAVVVFEVDKRKPTLVGARLLQRDIPDTVFDEWHGRFCSRARLER